MARIVVRGLDDAIMRWLSERAQRNQRSLEDEVCAILEERVRDMTDESVEERAVARDARSEVAADMYRKTVGHITGDSADSIRDDGDSR